MRDPGGSGGTVWGYLIDTHGPDGTTPVRTGGLRPNRVDAERDCETAIQLRVEIENFVVLWGKVSPVLPLDPNVRQVGDALSRMAADLAKAEDPPSSVLRTTFEWFAHKLDLAAEEASKVVGKGVGAAALAGGVAASGQLPRLIDAVGRVLQHLV
jgi:hypothetical protein